MLQYAPFASIVADSTCAPVAVRCSDENDEALGRHRVVAATRHARTGVSDAGR